MIKSRGFQVIRLIRLLGILFTFIHRGLGICPLYSGVNQALM
jgi:hypothetical protein